MLCHSMVHTGTLQTTDITLTSYMASKTGAFTFHSCANINITTLDHLIRHSQSPKGYFRHSSSVDISSVTVTKRLLLLLVKSSLLVTVTDDECLIRWSSVVVNVYICAGVESKCSCL